MKDEGDTGAQYMIMEHCRAMRVRSVITLDAEICEAAWPALKMRAVPDPIRLTPVYREDGGVGISEMRVEPALSTVQRMQTALGPDFVVDADMYQPAYRIGRKYISAEARPIKPATTRKIDPPPETRKPTAKRVKPGDHMKETPLVQRFSQLDLD